MKSILTPFKTRIFILLKYERERDDHMVVIKHLGKVEGQTKIYLQLFGYAKRHEEKRHGSKLFKESVTWQNLILSCMRSLLIYIYIYIYIC